MTSPDLAEIIKLRSALSSILGYAMTTAKHKRDSRQYFYDIADYAAAGLDKPKVKREESSDDSIS